MQNAIKNDNEHQQETIIQLKTQNKQLRVNLEANSLALALLQSSCNDPSSAKIPQYPVIRHFGINWDYTLGSNGLLFFSNTCAKAIGLLQAQQ